MVLVLLTSLNCSMSTLLSCALCSSSDTLMLKIQQYKCKTHGFRTFSCTDARVMAFTCSLAVTRSSSLPHIWNSLPQDLRHCSTLSSFKTKLKTFLFSQYFHPNYYQYPVSATVSVCVRACVRACVRVCVCACVCVCVCVYCFRIVFFTDLECRQKADLLVATR